MSLLLDVLSWVAIAIGAFAVLTASLGLLRLPEFFSRTHSVGLLDTLGAGMILLGFSLQSGLSLITFKLALVFVFILITGPTAAHALARSALQSGVKPMSLKERGEGSSER
ncbi:MAG: monovalent cation/H(+) antiporter subunit G [Halofilum sp. (in: g-proteobacteria)]